MIIQQDTNETTNQIDKYEPGILQINKVIYRHSVIITPKYVLEWPVPSFSELKHTHLDIILENQPTIFVLGTGAKYQRPDDRLLAMLYNKGIGIEIMDSLKACYTYTVLNTEGRNVMAAIILN